LRANLLIIAMIAFNEAFQIVNDSARVLDTERVALDDSLNRILAEDVFSDLNMPPFDKAAVDGYACRKADLEKELMVIETIPAGKAPEKVVGDGQCSKIMTGAVVPRGTDTIIMVEETKQSSENTIIFTGEKTKSNICKLGEDIRENDKVLNKGTLIRPQEIAVLASVGQDKPLVFQKPVVGVISTGDELVEPGIKPSPSQIRNSNGSQLIAQINLLNATPKYFGIASDTEESLREIIAGALQNSDVVLLTGGVSMGDFDHVPKVLKELGLTIKFKSIAVRPGKPTVFCTSDNKYLFGLPGNPVSSFVQFELLVKPLIFALMGRKNSSIILELPMAEKYTRKLTQRKTFLPVQIKNGKVYPVEYHGSAHIHSYIFADGIVAMERGETTFEKGEILHVRPI
jgi:molybdopterin molybdotransferase